MINIDIKSFALGVASNSGGGYPEPTGTKNITENGTYDIKDYANADVNVPADIEALSVTANGTYTASECDGFSPVTVDVPNSYSASDEGKVVNNGALVAQTSTTKNANGTYDTTLNNEVVIAVPQPSGNINITDMNQTNVADYATAQVVDADLVAGNIKKDVNILGVTGTYEGEPVYNILNVRDTPAKRTGQILVGNSWQNNVTSINYMKYNCAATNSVELLNPDAIDSSVTAFTGFTESGNGLVYADTTSVVFPSDFFDYYPNLTMISDRGMQGFAGEVLDLGNVTHIGWYSLDSKNLRVLKLPNVVTCDRMFDLVASNYALEKIDFSGNTSITTIPQLCYNYFQKDGIEVDLRGCVNITSIDSRAFFCNYAYGWNIYVPWSEGAVSGAPWGAFGATIHYDSV